MKNFTILVFPCGSEIGLEIHRSLKFSSHISLIGLSSVEDHGRMVYDQYIGDVPFYNEKGFLQKLNAIIKAHQVDAIYPAMDSVISFLAKHKSELHCNLITSVSDTTELCLSKTKTYQFCQNIINTPDIFNNIDHIKNFPVFMKPDIGYGSRGAKKIHSISEGHEHIKQFPSSIILEYLPGNEFTIDCFTNRHGKLLFSGARERKRIQNGISVQTVPVENKDAFIKIAEQINKVIEFRGAWFFQVKKNKHGELVLLEIASRLAGSSSLYRNLGVNFALLSVYDAFDIDVNIFHNSYNLELDRALTNKYIINIEYHSVYIDFDDCLLIRGKINTDLVKFIFQLINEQKRVVLITKHKNDILKTLKEYKLSELFDEIIHLSITDKKYKYIPNKNTIFIDDSYAERYEVYKNLNIPVFAPDNIEALMHL
ncbi:ATP-grasp domain-containing protein [Psychroserpens damuponensis]|uniref:ATP-grasp domain-containing protein n=1 Tax=Psychroserpens damuponensis TaxID=943936 RepID=UPI00058F9548|nr:ATP-grasp domain-containing protein [Psychroserpens damuponensis]